MRSEVKSKGSEPSELHLQKMSRQDLLYTIRYPPLLVASLLTSLLTVRPNNPRGPSSLAYPSFVDAASFREGRIGCWESRCRI